MIEAISTGLNSCYGRKGELIRFNNQALEYVMRKKLVIPGSINFLPTYSNGKNITPEEKAELIQPPHKLFYLHSEIHLINNSHKRIIKELAIIEKRQKRLNKLIKGKQNE